jgi:hypothetical protein
MVSLIRRCGDSPDSASSAPSEVHHAPVHSPFAVRPKRVAAKSERARFGATQGIRITLAPRPVRGRGTDARAMIVQGLILTEEPPWPGFKDLPDDACEASWCRSGCRASIVCRGSTFANRVPWRFTPSNVASEES